MMISPLVTKPYSNAMQAQNEIQMDKSKEQSPKVSSDSPSSTSTSSQYVLNIAFFSFVIFCIVEAIFALVGSSQSMMADAQAMAVDALSYLFNMGAEYLKNRPLSKESLRLPPHEQHHERELRRLHMELIPPAISVVMLMSVTVVTVVQASQSLWGKSTDTYTDQEEDVSIEIMLIFSLSNLLIDILNVTCFARAKAQFGCGVVEEEEQRMIRQSLQDFDQRADSFITEEGSLLSFGDENDEEATNDAETTSGFSQYGTILGENASFSSMDSSSKPDTQVNLNMCSAWTHICADTFRSIAVLAAAAIATLFHQVDRNTADAVAALAVSIIIFISLIPLIQGLILTAISIRELRCNPPHKKHALIKEIMI